MFRYPTLNVDIVPYTPAATSRQWRLRRVLPPWPLGNETGPTPCLFDGQTRDLCLTTLCERCRRSEGARGVENHSCIGSRGIAGFSPWKLSDGRQQMAFSLTTWQGIWARILTHEPSGKDVAACFSNSPSLIELNFRTRHKAHHCEAETARTMRSSECRPGHD